MAAATRADAPCDRPALLALPWWAPPRPPAPHDPPSHGRVTSGSDSESFQGLTRKSPCLSCTPSVCRMYATCPRGHPTSAPKVAQEHGGVGGVRWVRPLVRQRGRQWRQSAVARPAPVRRRWLPLRGRRGSVIDVDITPEMSAKARTRRRSGPRSSGPPGLQRSRDLTHLCSRELVHPFGASGLPA
jgi:hypothetical protein